ncbi:MAG: Gfo/Idh/MocA family oxidoreductase [Planctomycetota bacterium]|nr:Gfo/Idh/MocA family oxidoreductase [Planctomycetota bacterium]
MAKDGPIGIGIAGIGRAGWGMHCAELAGKENLFRIVAACDVLKDRRDKMAAKYGCRIYTRVEDMAANPDVELVDVATRSPEHLPHALIGLKAGKHVFLEKPICLTYAEALKLKAAAARAKGKLFIRHNRRFEPTFNHIREIMASGILGKVYEIKLRRLGYARRDDWQTLMKCGGGQMLNWGPHIIDHALRLLESPVKSVWADLKTVACVGDAEDHFKIILTGKNGRVIDIEISGGAAIKEPEYIVLGTKGGLTSSEEDITLRYLDASVKLPPRKPDPGAPGAHFGSPEKLPWIEKTIPVCPAYKSDMPNSIWYELHSAIRKGTRFPITTDESVAVMKVISAAKKGTKYATRK